MEFTEAFSVVQDSHSQESPKFKSLQIGNLQMDNRDNSLSMQMAKEPLQYADFTGRVISQYPVGKESLTSQGTGYRVQMPN